MAFDWWKANINLAQPIFDIFAKINNANINKYSCILFLRSEDCTAAHQWRQKSEGKIICLKNVRKYIYQDAFLKHCDCR